MAKPPHHAAALYPPAGSQPAQASRLWAMPRVPGDVCALWKPRGLSPEL